MDKTLSSGEPLAARMRPRRADELLGDESLLGPGTPLGAALRGGALHSMVLWGPPGSGKTSLARLLASVSDARFEALSATMSGVKDLRAVMDGAKQALEAEPPSRTVLFIDEVHRFNKSQQDAFLPFVEDGTLILIGATTENPSFELNRALLSRLRVYRLPALEAEDLRALLRRALDDEQRGLGGAVRLEDRQLERIAEFSGGDARRALNALERLAQLSHSGVEGDIDELLRRSLGETVAAFDKGGDEFYQQISALHKSVRGSDPDAALYWLARMLEGGCDPAYIARRATRMASEDIGNADPVALRLTLDAWRVWDRLGAPEGELALAQAIIYMACAPKSNACYEAMNQATADARRHCEAAVPMHLRNAPTVMMKEMGYGAGYRYDHDAPDAHVADQTYFPQSMRPAVYYQPSERGHEKRIAERLRWLRKGVAEKST